MSIHVAGVTTVMGNKAMKLEQPTIKDQCMDANWELFLKWARYKRSAMLQGKSIMDQLWACMDKPLVWAANNDWLDGCTTEEEVMKRIKVLAGKGQNICVNSQISGNGGKTEVNQLHCLWWGYKDGVTCVASM